MRNIKCADCAEYRNEWCEKVIDSPHPDMLRDCQYFHEKDGNGQERTGTDKHFVGDSKKVIDGLKMTMDLFLFNPSTGETLAPDDLNELNRITYDACKGAIELLSLQSEHATCYLDGPCEYQNINIALPSAQPELRWIPVTERLPDKEDWYIFSTDKLAWVAFWNGIEWSGGVAGAVLEDIIAWKPFPAPYRKEGECE